MLEIISPAAFAQYFADLAPVLPPRASPTSPRSPPCRRGTRSRWISRASTPSQHGTVSRSSAALPRLQRSNLHVQWSAEPRTDFVLGDAFARVLTETTQSLVCVIDAEGRILLFNDACERATGFSRDDVVGRDACDFVIPPEEREAFREVLAYVWRTGLTSPQVGHWLTKDGGRRLIAWSNKPLLSEDGTTRYLVTSGIDLTDRARSDEQDDRALEGDPGAKLAQIGQLAQEQRALRRVATLVASEASPDRVFRAVSEECARVLHVNASAVFRFEGDDTATIVGRHNRDNLDTFALGHRVAATPDTSIGGVLRTGAPARTDDWSEIKGEIADVVIQSGYRSTASAPITVAGITWGAVAIASEETLPPDTETRLGAFCELVSLAVASAQAREDLRASRARIVKAGDEQRRKLERNLHDGAQQRLVSLALQLRLARSTADHGPGGGRRAARAGLGGARCGARGATRARARAPPRHALRARPDAGARGAGEAAAGADRGRRA